MAGKRLLDAAKLFNAARSVGKQHFVLRQEQWDVYSRTSSLAKAVKNQTDRVTVTANAAYELAKRFNETESSWQPSQSSARSTEGSHSTRNEPEARDVPAEFTAQEGFAGEQSHDDQKPSSLGEREAWRSSEEQSTIARVDIQSPSDQSTNVENSNEFIHSVPDGAEIFQRTRASSSDKFFIQANQQTAEGDAEASEAEPSPGVNLDGIFSSGRVSREVGKTGPNIKNPYGSRKKLPSKPLPEMVKAEEQRKAQQAERAAASPSLSSGTVASTGAEGDAETQKLAESIAEESEVRETIFEAVRYQSDLLTRSSRLNHHHPQPH